MYERRSVSILSTEGLGTMEEQERQQVHFNQQTIICLEGAAIIAVFVTGALQQADHHLPGGRHHHCSLCHSATEADPAVAQVS